MRSKYDHERCASHACMPGKDIQPSNSMGTLARNNDSTRARATCRFHCNRHRLAISVFKTQTIGLVIVLCPQSHRQCKSRTICSCRRNPLRQRLAQQLHSNRESSHMHVCSHESLKTRGQCECGRTHVSRCCAAQMIEKTICAPGQPLAFALHGPIPPTREGTLRRHQHPESE